MKDKERKYQNKSKTIDLANERKDIDYITGDPYDWKNKDHVSNWATAFAQVKLAGKEYTEQEFIRELRLSKYKQFLDMLNEDGILIMTTDDTGSIVYKTHNGKPVMDVIRPYLDQIK